MPPVAALVTSMPVGPVVIHEDATEVRNLQHYGFYEVDTEE